MFLIKDLNLAITVCIPLKWLVKSLKERWSCWESNPGLLAYCASALPLHELHIYNSPATTPFLSPYVACSSYVDCLRIVAVCRLLMRENDECNHSWESDGWDCGL